MVSYVYSNHQGDPIFSPNSQIIMEGSQELLDLLDSFKEKNPKD